MKYWSKKIQIYYRQSSNNSIASFTQTLAKIIVLTGYEPCTAAVATGLPNLGAHVT